MAKVLVVEDDPMVAAVVTRYLTSAGHDVATLSDGATVLPSVQEDEPDVVVLDLMLPGMDGLMICRQLRERYEVPVVMLTARSDVDDRIVGLESGVDDYVTKPFSPRELVLRVDAVLRRTRRDGRASRLVDGDLVVDPAARVATRQGETLSLTVREFDLLCYLMSRPGVAFDRPTLLRQVWGWEFGDETTVTVHVRRVREKIEADPAQPQRLVTVRGVGYRWEAVAP